MEFCKRTGQKPPADRGTMLRSIYESLALKYRLVAEQIAAVSGKPNKVVHIVGGGSRNAFLNQLTANACGLKVVRRSRGGHGGGQRDGAGPRPRGHRQSLRRSGDDPFGLPHPPVRPARAGHLGGARSVATAPSSM